LNIYIFIIPLLGVILNVLYQIDCEEEASSIAHFFLYVLFIFYLTWSNEQPNVIENNKEHIVLGCCVLRIAIY